MSTDVFLKFEYGPRDILFATLLRKKEELPSRAALLLGGFALLAAAFLVFRVGPRWLGALSAWLVVIGAVHAAFTALRVVPHALFRKSAEDAAWMRQVRSDFWNRKMSVDASEEGIAVTVGRRSATLKWRECHGFESDARSHLLRHGKSGYLVVPRRAFRTEKKDEAFRELASRRADEPDKPVSAGPVTPIPALSLAEDPLPQKEPGVRATASAPKVGRNDPCPCGSGKKHKKCCLVSGVRS